MEYPPLPVTDLGRLGYAEAYEVQTNTLERVLAARGGGEGVPGEVLLVEHDPVITVSKRAGCGSHLLASAEVLGAAGIGLERTDRGGDITYHGPGQLVVYPIIDLNVHRLNLHGYMRLLEQAVIDACAGFGLAARRDDGATGVWVGDQGGGAKICAMGVRVRRWVTMHGLAINVTTDLSHFSHIVPCGLAGRPVTSLECELGERCPPMKDVKTALVSSLMGHLASAARAVAVDV